MDGFIYCSCYYISTAQLLLTKQSQFIHALAGIKSRVVGRVVKETLNEMPFLN